MRLELKRALVVAMLGLVFVWPALQFAIVRHTQSNPWHMFGLAMYTVPYRVIGVGVARIYEGQPQGLSEAKLTPELAARIEEYAVLFDGLGLWASRDPLLQALRAVEPDTDSFLVVPRILHVDLATGMLEVRKVRVDFPVR